MGSNVFKRIPCTTKDNFDSAQESHAGAKLERRERVMDVSGGRWLRCGPCCSVLPGPNAGRY